MVRPANHSDASALFARAGELAAKHYPKRRADVLRMYGLLNELLGSSKHYAWVAPDKEGKASGALLAFTADHIWAQRKQSHVLLWYSDLPGAGLELLRNYKGWVEAQNAIRVAGFQPDFSIEEGPLKVIQRLGFKRYGGSYLLYS